MMHKDGHEPSIVPRDLFKVRAQLPELTAEQLCDGNTPVVINGVSWSLWQVAHLYSNDPVGTGFAATQCQSETSQGSVFPSMSEVRVEGRTLSRREPGQQGVECSEAISFGGEMTDEKRLRGKISCLSSRMSPHPPSPFLYIFVEVGLLDIFQIAHTNSVHAFTILNLPPNFYLPSSGPFTSCASFDAGVD